jgi:hypothetical protein
MTAAQAETVSIFGFFKLQAALGKTLRWGWDGYNPELPMRDRESNSLWVRREMKDVREALDNLEREMDKNL